MNLFKSARVDSFNVRVLVPSANSVGGFGWKQVPSKVVRKIKEAPPIRVAPPEDAGDGLLSRVLSNGVPSALQGLTTVFGMGTGVAPALQSPAIFKMTLDCSSDRVMFESTVRSLGFLLVGSSHKEETRTI